MEVFNYKLALSHSPVKDGLDEAVTVNSVKDFSTRVLWMKKNYINLSIFMKKCTKLFLGICYMCHLNSKLVTEKFLLVLIDYQKLDTKLLLKFQK